jgi:hypothetical protein
MRGSLSVSPAQASPQAGTTRISHVPDASLHASHALQWTPAEPRAAHQKRCLCIGFWRVKTIALCILLVTRLCQAWGSAVSPAGYVVPCVRFTCFVQLYIEASSTVATLGMSGWLDLAQPGLAPGKKRQASLGALTPERTASRPAVSFQLQQSRHRAAMRCRAGLGQGPTALPPYTSRLIPGVSVFLGTRRTPV